MTHRARIACLLAAFSAALLCALPAAAQQALQAAKGPARIEVSREADNMLRVEARLLGGAKLDEISASLAGVDLPRQNFERYPYGDSISSILFLIDTSDPARQPVVDRIVAQIGEMLKMAKPHQRFGLAVFDSDLVIKVAPGSSPDAVAAALADVKAAGRTTEMYRSVMSAITRVGVVPAARKSVFLFSDGLAEDTAYKAEDVIAAGRAAEVVIQGFGFARTPAQSVALQSVRRLAEDTGGRYFAADAQNSLPPEALSEPVAAMDAGGTATFQMTPAANQGGGRVVVRLDVTGGPIELQVGLPALPAPPEDGWRVWIRDRDNQAIVALAGVFLIGLLAILIAGHRRRRARYLKKLADGHFDEPEAWLEFLDGDGRHVGVTGSAFRVGRNKDNDLVLGNDSVSGHHAVIHKTRDGSFSITDLQSANGVLVNLSQVQAATLNNGDLIELGEARFRFRAHPRSMPADGPTLGPANPVPAPAATPEPDSDPYAGLVTIDEAETRLQDPLGMSGPDQTNGQDEDDVATVSPAADPERR